jgi:TPR repeat protein
LACKLCARWRARLWERSDAWERARSNESELWAEEPVQVRELIQRAHDSRKIDPVTAFRLYLDAAETGSAWAMEAVAYHYETGAIVATDLAKAQEYYRRATCAGSWMATINYARLLAEKGRHGDCERVLEDGVSSDFVPAYFWLAWFRYKRCKGRKACREIRPILEYAAKAGHPAARVMLGQLMILGKFGVREIPAGLRWAFRSASGADEDIDDQGVAVAARGLG